MQDIQEKWIANLIHDKAKCEIATFFFWSRVKGKKLDRNKERKKRKKFYVVHAESNRVSLMLFFYTDRPNRVLDFWWAIVK